MSERPCYRNRCPNEADARITIFGGVVLKTMTFDLCPKHYYEVVCAITGQPVTVGAIPRAEHEQPVEGRE